MQKQADRLGITGLNFVDAVDGSKLTIDSFITSGLYDGELAVRYEGRQLGVNIIATALSHANVWEIVAFGNKDYVLVLEDDAIFRSNLFESVNPSLIPKKWDVCLLEAWLRNRPPKGYIWGNCYDLRSYIGGAGAYLLSQRGALKLFGVSKPVIHPADGFFTWYNRHLSEKKPPIVFQTKEQLHTYLWFPLPVINGSTAGFWTSSLRTPFYPY